MSKKKFVLDTNILINNPKCVIDSFDENDVILPFTVIEELDNLKTKEGIGYSAREALRNIEKIRKDSIDIRTGVVRNEKGGLLRIVTMRDSIDELPIDILNIEGFDISVPDNRIVLTALKISKEDDTETVFISNDCNARIKASFLELKAERYLDDVVPEEYLSYTGMRKVEMPLSFFGDVLDGKFIAKKNFYTIDINEEPFKDMNIIENEYVLLDVNESEFEGIELSKKEKKHLKHVYRKTGDFLDYRELNHTMYGGVRGKNLSQSVAIDLLMDENIKVLTMRSVAGGGKTLLSTSYGFSSVIHNKLFDKIIFLKPTISAHEDIGFLPGTTDQKMLPYMGSFLDNCNVLKKMETVNSNSTNADDFDSMVKKGLIEIENIGFLRGRSITDSLIILDEAQNLSTSVAKTIVSRVGEGSKILILGDPTQIDDRFLSIESNALSHIIKNLRGERIYAHVDLESCVRSEVSRIAGLKL